MRYFLTLLLTFFLLSGAVLAGKRVHIWSEIDFTLKIARAVPPVSKIAPGWRVPQETLRDVTLEVTLTDSSIYRVQLDPIAPAHYFRATVMDAEGKPVAETKSFTEQKKRLKWEIENPAAVAAARAQTMKDPLAEWHEQPPTMREQVARAPLQLWPRESYTFIYPVSTLYDMSKPGKYTVRLELDSPPDLGKWTMTSNTLEVTVEAPPPEEAKTAEPAPANPGFTSEEEDRMNKQVIVENSIKAFKGSCPCPYSVDASGASCEKKNAYRKGRVPPLCFESDVTDEMLAAYKTQFQNYAPPGYVPGQRGPQDPVQLEKQVKFIPPCVKRVREETSVRDFSTTTNEYGALDFTGGKDNEDLFRGIEVFKQCMIEHGASPVTILNGPPKPLRDWDAKEQKKLVAACVKHVHDFVQSQPGSPPGAFSVEIPASGPLVYKGGDEFTRHFKTSVFEHCMTDRGVVLP